MRSSIGTTLLLGLLLLAPLFSYAQLRAFEDVEAVRNPGFFKTYFSDLFRDFKDYGNAFSMAGGVGLNMRSYRATGIEPRQDPFFYSMNANLNIRIYQLNIPFSLLVTAKNRESSLPNFREIRDAFKNNIEAQRDRFVRFGISPHYKWIKMHLGHRTMSFSKYTLSNLVFFGAGTELTPGKWRVGAMYGRLARAEPIDLSLATPNLPVYQRMGWGAKVGYGTDDGSVDLIVFKARDDENSIEVLNTGPDQVTPQENLTLGLNLQKRFFERFRFRAELGLSYLSPNSLDAEANTGMVPGFLFQERTTTERGTAIDAALDYEGQKFTTGIQLKRIEPEYQSFGAYFFNNDIVDLVGNLRFGMLQGLLNVQLSGGVQSNNLDVLSPTTTRRFIYSADLAYAKEAFSANANYSNNTTDIGYVLNPELDSLNAVIVTANSGMTFNYSLTDAGENQHIFTLTGNLQTVGDDIENPMESSESQMLVGSFIYNYLLAPSQWRFTAKLNYNQNEVNLMQITRFGGGGGVTKSFQEGRLSLGLDFNYFANSTDVGGAGSNLNGQLRAGYQIAKGLNANLSWGLLRTDNTIIAPYTEVIGNLGVRYSFQLQPLARRDSAEAATDTAPTPQN
jgi:hypothetical protein